MRVAITLFGKYRGNIVRFVSARARRAQPQEFSGEGLRVGRDAEELEVGRADELLGDGVVEKVEKGVEVAVDVEQADRFGVQPERRPGQGFEELFISAKAPGKSEEARTDSRHQGLSLVHAGDDV